MQLLDIFLLDGAHEIATAEEIGREVVGDSAGDDGELIVYHFGPGNGAAGRDEVSAPLIDEAGVPEGEDGEKEGEGGKSAAGRGEEGMGAFEEKSKSENKNRGEGDQKAIAEGGHAVPIGIAGNDVVEGQGGEGEIGDDFFGALGGKKETGEGESEEGGPGQKTVFGGKQDGEPMGGVEIPGENAVGTKAKEAAKNNPTGDESGGERRKIAPQER